MKLIDHDGAELEFDHGGVGDHTAILTIDGEGFALRPDSGIALAATLWAWASDRTNKAGLF